MFLRVVLKLGVDNNAIENYLEIKKRPAKKGGPVFGFTSGGEVGSKKNVYICI